MPSRIADFTLLSANVGAPDLTREQNSRQREMLLFTFEYPPVSGGISRLCEEISGNLKHERIQVNVLTQARPSSVPPVLCESHVDVRRPFREWQAFRWLRKFKRQRAGNECPTVCGIWYPEGLIAYFAGVRPLVILAHGAELLPPASRWRRRLWSALQRRVLESANLVIANSEYTRQLVARAASKSRVQEIPLAVDVQRFAPGDREAAKKKLGVEGKRVLCTVARLHPYKGIDIVLHAMANLTSEERNDVVYLIVGRGPHEQELKDLAVTLGVTQHIRWLGFVAEEELPEIYHASDLFVLCTRDAPEQRSVEGFGLVFLEAQSSGVPVVGTNTGGISAAIRDGDGGWLIEQDDATALAGIFRKLVREPEVFHAAGTLARQRALRESTWKSYSQCFSAALQSVGAISSSL
jgi:phosphatidylinositol alpha-1,6-mannosyltransferase